MNNKHDPMNRRDFLTASGLATISAAALTPGAASAQTPSAEGAGLESALKKALEAAKDAQSAASPVTGAAGVLSAEPWTSLRRSGSGIPATARCRIHSSCSAAC